MTGYVEGMVQQDARNINFWGGRALLASVAALVVVALVTHGVEIVHGLIAALMPVIIVVGIVAWVLSRSNRGSSVMGGMARAGSSLAQGVVRTGGSGARQSAGALLRTGSAGFSITLHRFRVKDLLGNVTSCLLVGDTDADLRQGDLVRVAGTRDRGGLVKTRKVEVLDHVDQPARLTIRTSLGLYYRAAQAFDLLAKLLSLGAVAIVVVLLTR